MASVEARLAFTRRQDVEPDPGSGLLRARSLDPDALHGPEAFDHHACRITDCSEDGGVQPDIKTHGFGHVDLCTLPVLPPIFERVRTAGHVTEDDSRAIRRALVGSSLPLAHGRRLRLLFIAPEGFIMRRSGPNGLRITDSATARGMNDHDAAVSVHADQDVHGTPVRQILRGAAPYAFHHSSPGARNRLSPLFLLNLWVPLQQVTRPLALMDGRSLDRRAQQLRYALPTDGFLDRPPDRRVNDIWTFLHSPEQRWFFTSDAGPERAWIFETLSTPHGSFILPGEARAEQLYLRLRTARKAVASGDPEALRHAIAEPLEAAPEPETRALAEAIEALQRCLRDAGEAAESLCAGAGREPWEAAAAAAMDRVVRKSLEMRALGLVTRDWLRPWRQRALPEPERGDCGPGQAAVPSPADSA